MKSIIVVFLVLCESVISSYGSVYSITLASNKFCYSDQATGLQTQLTIHDGGDAEIVFLNSSGNVVRRGPATWHGTSDGPGGDMAKLYLRLSTGVTLTFNMVVDQYSSRITMLLDSRENMWIACN